MRNLMFVIAAAGLLAGCASQQTADGDGRAPAADRGDLYRHVVLFKFKDGASDKQVRKVEREFAALEGRIGLIRDLEWGTDVSPENKNKGFTHCFLVTFDNKRTVKKYIKHPAHQKFLKTLKPVLKDALVVDYEPE